MLDGAAFGVVNSTYATPRMMGSVNVEELVDFSHGPELLSAAQVLPESDDELVDVALRGSTTRFGTAILIIDSILPIIFVAGVATRGPNLTISSACRLSMVGRGKPVANCRFVRTWASDPVENNRLLACYRFEEGTSGIAITIKANLSAVVFDMIVS
jgi:hypothetical protein